MVRFTRLLLTGVLTGASLVAGAAGDNPLEAERWRTRPLVIVVPASSDPLLAQFELALRSETERAAFSEREMVLYTVVAGVGRRQQQSLSANQTRALLDAIGVSAGSPGTVVLVGKDGGVKVRKGGSSVSFDELFATIDQMPMRQR
jgi:hypothetical protein